MRSRGQSASWRTRCFASKEVVHREALGLSSRKRMAEAYVLLCLFPLTAVEVTEVAR